MDKTLDRAWLLMGSNRFERSEQEIRKHLSENPDDPRAHTMLAMCLFDLSRHDEAIESGKKAIELVPDNPYPYWVLACLYIRLQQLDSAEEYLYEAIELDPEYPDFYASLSELYWMRGCSQQLTHEQNKEFLEKGVEAARTGLEIEAEHFNSILFLIRNILAIEDSNHILEAIELAEELLSLSPENAIAHEAYAQALICEAQSRRTTKQDLNRILPIIEESLRLNPNRSYSKILAYDLLRSHHRILAKNRAWQSHFIVIMTFVGLLLSILTFYFYNTCGLQVFPTIISSIVTIISLAFMIDLTQSHMRIWLNRQYCKLLQSNKADKLIDMFWLLFAVITILGFTWKILPLGLIRLITLMLWILVFIVGICLFFLIRRSPWWLSRGGRIDPNTLSKNNNSSIEYENIDFNRALKNNWPYIISAIVIIIFKTVFFSTNPPSKKPLNQLSTSNYVIYPIVTQNKPEPII